MQERSRVVPFALIVGWLGCAGEEPGASDAGHADAGLDAGHTPLDAGAPTLDAAADAGEPRVDAGHDASIPASSCRPELDGGQVVDLAADGRSAELTLAFDPPASQIEVALVPEAAIDGHSCFGVESVAVEGDVWVGAGSNDTQDVCVSCAQPVRLHPERGMFVFPSGPSTAPFRAITLQVAVRDCETLLRPSVNFPVGPTRVRVAARPIAARALDERLHLRAGLVAAAPSLLAMSEEARSDYLDAVEQTVREAFAAASIDIDWSRASPPRESPLHYEPAARENLDALYDVARAALEDDGAVPLILAPCLERGSITGTSRPLGTTPHVPGSCNVPHSAVYVASESCLGGGLSFVDPAALGVVAAHELGHHLGLFHVGEAGFPSDRESGEANLMQASPVASLTLTPQQIEVVRRHPDLVPRQRR